METEKVEMICGINMQYNEQEVRYNGKMRVRRRKRGENIKKNLERGRHCSIP